MPPPAETGVDAAVSPGQRFVIPFTFKPQLAFVQAVISAFGAFLRIFFGSLLFAVWGTYSLLLWTTVRNPFWRVAVLLPILVMFVATFTLLMLVINASVRAATRCR